MTRVSISAFAPVLVLAACAGAPPSGGVPDGVGAGAGGGGGGRSSDEPAYGGGDEAVQAEFATAERAGTAEAYRLFAERHPRHPRAPEARRRAGGLAGSPGAG